MGFAIDDFGTGYSSLTYLSQLPVDELKIDQSFVANMMTEQDDASIVRAVIDVAGNLGKRVLAEGVETRAQWQQLQRLGCDLFQGYLFARPVPLDEFVPLVATVMPSETA